MAKTKVIAFYLPQFHEIPENNEWWGTGFTEWTNVRKAKPLFEKHYQPRIPLNRNYYNLLDEKTQEWQAELAKKYGIHGFCYYHYWFNGKMLLEKPMENMLNNKNVDIPFCISWANEPWARTWDGKDKEVLMPQVYGDKNDWKNHFEYLLQFFKDERYIKVNNKPVMLIYRTNNIEKCSEMVQTWNDMAKENGFEGVYIVETLNSFQNKPAIDNSEAVVEFEPMLTIRHYLPIYKQCYRYLKKKLKILDVLEYDDIWERIVERDIDYGKKKYSGAFVSWDNTARKGKKGLVTRNSTPDKFKCYLKKQLDKAESQNSEFVFINAWNEWAEGTYLEPDEKCSFDYLEKIKELT
ncbi:glycosyltransferase WbsX family protein [Oceanirhabdus sp. W0125-5]|uniref:glycosyltransferase WbsX family protein n=1 Tax=Oceanirhabdus sp. W0125-5 TaxID=2999116 RepID=UPI0022F2FCA2|nr:glycoside hydrolase family 99-like domain-containing protein [Oceanirhabdus sp. W0125-5]WBW98663.1 glycoside hydrolase family 99-like domain-containing protein [Oceanirhabdus sp. W0125-5]